MTSAATANTLEIADNQFVGITQSGGLSKAVVAISVHDAKQRRISKNLTNNVAAHAIQPQSRDSIEVVGCRSRSFRAIKFSMWGGPMDYLSVTSGVQIRQRFSEVLIRDNTIRRREEDSDGAGPGSWPALVLRAGDFAVGFNMTTSAIVVNNQELEGATHLAVPGSTLCGPTLEKEETREMRLLRAPALNNLEELASMAFALPAFGMEIDLAKAIAELKRANPGLGNLDEGVPPGMAIRVPTKPGLKPSERTEPVAPVPQKRLAQVLDDVEQYRASLKESARRRQLQNAKGTNLAESETL